jgi:hypothetical protein
MRLSEIYPKVKGLKDIEGDIDKVYMEGYWNDKSKTGFLHIVYRYKGLKVCFISSLYLDVDSDKIELYTKMDGFEDYLIVDSSTINNEDIPSLRPIKWIAKSYRIEKMIELAHKYIIKLY